jgi:hypothetical protein
VLKRVGVSVKCKSAAFYVTFTPHGQGASGSGKCTGKSEMNQLADWVLPILAALIATGVAGLWRLSFVVAQLQVTVANWTKVFEDRFIVVTDTTRDHEKRIGKIEATTAVHHIVVDRFFSKREAKDVAEN